MILMIGDNSTEYNKHSMASDKRLNVVDLTSKSVIFTYNRPCDLNKKGGHFFEQVWSNVGAVKDRYPMLLLKGQVTETMTNFSMEQANKLVEDNFETMRQVGNELCYWTRNIHIEMHKVIETRTEKILVNDTLTGIASEMEISRSAGTCAQYGRAPLARSSASVSWLFAVG